MKTKKKKTNHIVKKKIAATQKKELNEIARQLKKIKGVNVLTVNDYLDYME